MKIRTIKNIKGYKLNSYSLENGISLWCRTTDKSCIGRKYNFNKEFKSGIMICTTDYPKVATFGGCGDGIPE